MKIQFQPILGSTMNVVRYGSRPSTRISSDLTCTGAFLFALGNPGVSLGAQAQKVRLSYSSRSSTVTPQKGKCKR